VKIEITGELLQQARAAAYQRQQNRRRAGSRDYSGGQPVQLTGLPGVLREVALHQFFGLELDWTFLATDAGFCQPDVGGLWEVRATLNPRARRRWTGLPRPACGGGSRSWCGCCS